MTFKGKSIEILTLKHFKAFIHHFLPLPQRLQQVYHQQEDCQGNWLGTYLAAKPPQKSIRNISIMELVVGPEKGWGCGKNL